VPRGKEIENFDVKKAHLLRRVYIHVGHNLKTTLTSEIILYLQVKMSVCFLKLIPSGHICQDRADAAFLPGL
jgi:hypothetical protein